MFLVNILSLILLILIISRKYGISAVCAWPAGVCIMVLFMYVLAFVRGLWAIDFISVAFIIGFIISLFAQKNSSYKEELIIYRKLIFNVQFIASLIFFTVLAFLVMDKKVTWWDDYNFWAADAKSIFGLNGFSSKYANVAPEFGDYPPGTQMFKWWFNHLSPGEFNEGLMFSGYYFMLFSFLMPFLSFARNSRKLLNILCTAFSCVMILLFPATVEAFWCDGCCADTIMAVIFGSFIIGVIITSKESDNNTKNTGGFVRFHEVNQYLLLAVLSLSKNTAFLWLFLAVLFYMVIHIFVAKDFRIKAFLKLVASPVLALGSWYGFCLIMRRVAKLTGSAVSMVTGTTSLPEYQGELTRVYVNAFLKYPLHRYENGIINLSPLSLLILFIVAVTVLCLFKKVSKKEGVVLGIYIIIAGAAFYIFDLVCHLTIFANETQYLEEFAMVSSMERYGAPFTIGIMMLLIYLSLKNAKKWVSVVVISLFIMLTTDYESTYRTVNGYRKTIDETMNTRSEIIDEKGWNFLKEIEGKKNERILYVRDVNDISWVRNTYMAFEASPVSLVFRNMDLEVTDMSEIEAAMKELHASSYHID